MYMNVFMPLSIIIFSLPRSPTIMVSLARHSLVRGMIHSIWFWYLAIYAPSKHLPLRKLCTRWCCNGQSSPPMSLQHHRVILTVCAPLGRAARSLSPFTYLLDYLSSPCLTLGIHTPQATLHRTKPLSLEGDIRLSRHISANIPYGIESATSSRCAFRKGIAYLPRPSFSDLAASSYGSST